MQPRSDKPTVIERIIAWVGSLSSLIVHTILFLASFASVWLGLVSLNSMLLTLTTIVSLEAIYLAILIQITVNKNTASLREVEEDIDEIQEDVEELGEDVEDIQEDIEEISEDIDEIQEDVEEMSEEEEKEEQDRKDAKMRSDYKDRGDVLDKLTDDVRRILEELETLKRGN
jgi:methyl-accepting chemotaxis protein